MGTNLIFSPLWLYLGETTMVQDIKTDHLL